MSMTKDDPNLLVLLLCNIDRRWFPHEIEAAVHEGVKSVAGHLTIFVTRTRGRFWSIRPFRLLFLAVVGTQAVATLIAVYGVFMTPIGWGCARA